MTVFLILLAVVAVIAALVFNNRRRRADYEEFAAANSLDPRLEAVLRRGPDDDWRDRRNTDAAVREHTSRILGLLREHQEQPTLLMWSGRSPFGGLLLVTTGRTVMYGNALRSDRPVPHEMAQTTIRARGADDPNPFVTIVGGGQMLEFGCSSVDNCQVVCNAIDIWAEGEEVATDRQVSVTRHGVDIPLGFYVETLRSAGHAATFYNLRSIHERFGMQFHTRAMRRITEKHGEHAAQRFTARVGRPERDEDLPGWPTRVLEEWIALEPDVSPMAAAVPYVSRALLLRGGLHGGGYLSDPSRPLSMWREEWYADNGRGRRLPGQPPMSS